MITLYKTKQDKLQNSILKQLISNEEILKNRKNKLGKPVNMDEKFLKINNMFLKSYFFFPKKLYLYAEFMFFF